jgi:hypothetical protein
MAFPLAYLITFAGYGQRLHGDERLTIDDRWTEIGDPVINPNPNLLAYERSKLKHAPFEITARARRIIRTTIERHCEIRGWTLHAQNVRLTHLHAVVTCDCDPDRAMDQFKAWCTRNLRKAGLAGDDQRPWVVGGSKRFLWDMQSLADAVDYVLNQQGPPLPEE